MHQIQATYRQIIKKDGKYILNCSKVKFFNHLYVFGLILYIPVPFLIPRLKLSRWDSKSQYWISVVSIHILLYSQRLVGLRYKKGVYDFVVLRSIMEGNTNDWFVSKYQQVLKNIVNSSYHEKEHFYLCYHEKRQSFINKCATKYNDKGQ